MPGRIRFLRPHSQRLFRSQFPGGNEDLGQITDALKRAESGLAVPELCRELGISSATFYKWRSKYGNKDTSQIADMKELEAENARLRKMYAEEKTKAEIVAEALAKKD